MYGNFRNLVLRHVMYLQKVNIIFTSLTEIGSILSAFKFSYFLVDHVKLLAREVVNKYKVMGLV